MALRKQRWAFPAGLIAATVLGGSALVGSGPANVLSRDEDPDVPRVVATLLPQGWGFFTRDAREATYTLWSRTSSGWSDTELSRETRAGYAFGADRAGRMVGVDLDYLVGRLDEKRWVKCSVGETASCLSEVKTATKVSLRAAQRDVCGVRGLVRASAVPWAYARFTREARTEVQVVEISC